jgi:hypothetical protein
MWRCVFTAATSGDSTNSTPGEGPGHQTPNVHYHIRWWFSLSSHHMSYNIGPSTWTTLSALSKTGTAPFVQLCLWFSQLDWWHWVQTFDQTALKFPPWTKGCYLDGCLINQAIQKHHLHTVVHDDHCIFSLVSPNDKQDVKLVYDLLSAVAVLPPADNSEAPAVHHTCMALHLLGSLYSHLLETYTNVHVSLHDQLLHLSATAHLIITIYANDKGCLAKFPQWSAVTICHS